jgi:hypothetical protein
MNQGNAALSPIRGSASRRQRPIPLHSSREPRPFSLEPVWELLELEGFDLEPYRGNRRSQGQVTAAALRLGVGRQVLTRWDRSGIGVYVADSLAIRLGVHPAALWPNWFSADVDDELKVAA